MDAANDDGCSLTPGDMHQYLGRVMYNRSPPTLFICVAPSLLMYLWRVMHNRSHHTLLMYLCRFANTQDSSHPVVDVYVQGRTPAVL